MWWAVVGSKKLSWWEGVAAMAVGCLAGCDAQQRQRQPGTQRLLGGWPGGLTRGGQHDVGPALQDGCAELWRQLLPVAPRAPKPHLACRQQQGVRCISAYDDTKVGWSRMRTAPCPCLSALAGWPHQRSRASGQHLLAARRPRCVLL